MSLFKSLQKSPRTISLFCDNFELNKSCSTILQFLKGETSNNFNLELVSTFPTLDQLKYTYKINPIIMNTQIPNLHRIMKLESFDPVFGSNLQKCAREGRWNPKVSLWVDWERKCIGNDLKSIQELLKLKG
ncbi:putative redox protein NDAI_0B05330 [Naumovozyma dairenensis CBS 421]|uniref:Uncharacterized protein n=1 Tax=Naumovozyma dairenensis (strain ATCC 10597 / BCRC 20456 / CBS 421 / NBRC 0211 / NRRL Y-12639) TaxID=1071378 RepID=G0W705_NAUDC|nr:hypothetical protein NDAI_0B05330 [Naumovozyma dairenensis CBS 421]CCD23566.1 hypothetical protein NDAI_0B05330 [Naumovozyma dairenensis CBS 421]